MTDEAEGDGRHAAIRWPATLFAMFILISANDLRLVTSCLELVASVSHLLH